MQKKRKKIDVYKGYRIALILLAALYIVFVGIMTLIVEDVDAFFIVAGIVKTSVVLIALMFGLIIVAGESDKNAIRILKLDFDRVDMGMKQLQDVMPDVFMNCNYINTYVYNVHDNCYYQIYTKDEIKWMRNIGKVNPREKY